MIEHIKRGVNEKSPSYNLNRRNPSTTIQTILRKIKIGRRNHRLKHEMKRGKESKKKIVAKNGDITRGK